MSGTKISKGKLIVISLMLKRTVDMVNVYSLGYPQGLDVEELKNQFHKAM